MSEVQKPQVGGEPPVSTDDDLVAFLYLLLRDHVSPGALEGITVDIESWPGGHKLTNRFLAEYAENIASRLRQDKPALDPCAHCGHPRHRHARETGCIQTIEPAPNTRRQCGCMAFVEPTP